MNIKTLIMIAIGVAICLLAIGILIVGISGGIGFLSSNALLRLTDTSLLFAITLMLFTIAFQKKG